MNDVQQSSARERDILLPDGRTLHVYDRGGDGVPVIWQHGTPNVGTPPRPLVALADELGLRWVSFDRPAYGGSTANPGRSVGSVARDVGVLADTLGLDAFAVFGHSGGGSHAVACAAEHGDRVLAVVSIAGLAPIDAHGLKWFDGMGPVGTAALQAAYEGVDGKRTPVDGERTHDDATPEDATPEATVDFIARDVETLAGPWGWLGEVVTAGLLTGTDGLIDDDIAYVTPWRVDLGAITAPVLLLHGGKDRVVPATHSRWLRATLPTSEYWHHADDGHLSVLDVAERGADDALRWVAERAAR